MKLRLVTIQTMVDTDCVYDTFTASMIQSELLRAEGEFCKETGINRKRRFNILRLPENPRLSKIEVRENGKRVPNEEILVPSRPLLSHDSSASLQSELENLDMTEKEKDRPMHCPPVDPVELSKRWKLMHGIMSVVGTQQVTVDLRDDTAKTDEAKEANALNAQAVHMRVSILGLMERHQLLKDWIRDGELDEIAIRVMAKYPLEPMKVGVLQKPQGSLQSGHVGSLQNRPYKKPGKAPGIGLWKIRQARCPGNHRTIPTFPQPQQQHRLIELWKEGLFQV